jgi:hypothetical protein
MYVKLLQELTRINVITQVGKINPKYKILLNQNPQIKQVLTELTCNIVNDLTNIREQLYCVINNITSKTMCKQCKTQTVRFINDGKKRNSYHDYCSLKCSNNSDEVKFKKEQTSFVNWGVSNPSKTKIIKQKKCKTSTLRYGVNYPWQQGKQIDLLNDASWLYLTHHTQQRTLTEIAAIVGVDVSIVSTYMKRHNIEIKNFSRSSGEKEIAEFLIEHNIQFKTNTRSIISPLELDIYIPSFNLAIEYCGVYWHSDVYKDKQYHSNKHNLCKNLNIQLLTIFEDEWLFRKDQVKRKILHLLNLSEKTTYARKCSIKTITTHEKREFFEKNHIQGNGPGSINLALHYDNVIVAVMSFISRDECYYLNRYATTHTIIGGFDKLFKHFVKNIKNSNIPVISFADARWSVGKMYERCGWKFVEVIPPDYTYSLDGLNRIHKFNFRRKFLEKRLNHFDTNLSEKQNCNNNGVIRVWDCGKYKFVYE